MPFAVASMGLEIISLSEVSQTEKGEHRILLLCEILKKKDTNELAYKTEGDPDKEKLWLPKRKGGGIN